MNYLLTKYNIDDVFRNFTENDSLTICKDFPYKYILCGDGLVIRIIIAKKVIF